MLHPSNSISTFVGVKNMPTDVFYVLTENREGKQTTIAQLDSAFCFAHNSEPLRFSQINFCIQSKEVITVIPCDGGGRKWLGEKEYM